MFSYMDQQQHTSMKPSEQPYYYYYPTWPVSQQQQQQQQQRLHYHHHYHHHQPLPPQHHHHQPTVPEEPSPQLPQQASPTERPKITQSVWEDQNTYCYQVDARGICVARRQDNDMVNGTKLLNVAGISRGKRDGILKNESGRVVVKVGAMHLKGVWITFTRAKALAAHFDIEKLLHPLFEDNPTRFYEQKQARLAHQDYMNPPFYLSPTPPPQQEPMTGTPTSLATLTTVSTSSLDLPHIQHFPYSYPDEWELSLVLNNSSILSDSAPGTPDLANMYPPHDGSATAVALGLSPYPFTSMMSLPQAAADDLYYYYQH